MACWARAEVLVALVPALWQSCTSSTPRADGLALRPPTRAEEAVRMVLALERDRMARCGSS